jgi:hypothetical protein
VSKERRPPLAKPLSASVLLETLLREQGLTDKLHAYQAWQVWDEVVGAQIAARAQPIRLREGVLEIRVDHPVWMQQLQLLKPRLLARLNDRLGAGTIRDLFLRQGRKRELAESEQPASPSWRTVALDPAENERIEAVVAGLEDSELRRHLATLCERQLRLEKARHNR